MRYLLPHTNDERIVKRFAFTPICIKRECRVLETVYIRQRYYNDCWHSEEFVDRPMTWQEMGLP